MGWRSAVHACKKLLTRIDSLRAMCPLRCLRYVTALEDFNLVVNSCFGETLNPQFRRHIEKFRDSYMALGIQVTPKVHAVFYHVGEFCSSNNCSLGVWSEQASESVHADFKKVWKRYKVVSSHPNYFKMLLRAVCDYNCMHL